MKYKNNEPKKNTTKQWILFVVLLIILIGVIFFYYNPLIYFTGNTGDQVITIEEPLDADNYAARNNVNSTDNTSN